MKHAAGLDGIRAFAVLAIAAYHLRVTNGGLLGVTVFFTLSGYLITSILLRSKDKPHYFRNFYARRSIRIFPLYYAVPANVFWNDASESPWISPSVSIRASTDSERTS